MCVRPVYEVPLMTDTTPSHSTTVHPLRAAVAAALISVTFTATTSATAEETFGALNFQDDVYFGQDGGYSSGVSFAWTRVASPGEASIAPPFLLAPIVAWLGMPQATLASWRITQTITTPSDIERAVPDPNDSPYVGSLVFRSTHVSVHADDADVADMLALDLGLIGPASGAAQTQRFAHRLTGSKHPQGWAHQVPNQALVSAEGYRAWRFASTGGGGASSDMVVLGGGAVGSLQGTVGAGVMLRYGTQLQRSFPTVMRVAGRRGEPFQIGSGWFVYAGLSGDSALYRADIGGDSAHGDNIRERRSQALGVVGLSYGWAGSSLSFSVQNASTPYESSRQRQSYGSITYSRAMP